MKSELHVSNLSVVVLALNEEQRIGRCLKSLAFAAKVIVIDSFSKDQTRERCFDAWKEVNRDSLDLFFVQKEWEGFTRTRNHSLDWVKTDWVLWVDADEWVNPDLTIELKEICDNEPLAVSEVVYQMPRLSVFLGREIRHGGWYPDRKARLAKTKSCEWRSGPNQSDVHEDLWPLPSLPQKRGLLKNHLGHEPFLSRQEQRQTNLRYSALLAEGLASKRLAQKKSIPSNFYIWVKVGIKFIENYLLKRGCLDGSQGFVIALGSAQSLYWRFQKVREIMQKALTKQP